MAVRPEDGAHRTEYTFQLARSCFDAQSLANIHDAAGLAAGLRAG